MYESATQGAVEDLLYRLLTVALTLPKQHEPCGLRISHPQLQAFASAAMRCGMGHLPVARISPTTIGSVKPK